MSKKKKYILITILALVFILGLLWLVGYLYGNNQENQERDRLALALEEYNKHLSAVRRTIEEEGSLNRFDSSNIPEGYQLSDIKTTDQVVSQDELKEYAQILSITLNPLKHNRSNPLDLVIRAYDFNDTQAQQELLQQANMYKAIEKELIEIVAPLNEQIAHNRLINDLSRISFILETMSKVLKQPTEAFEASFLYPERAQALARTLIYINQDLEAQGIKFSDEERVNIYIPY